MHEAFKNGWLLPGPDALLAGPTFAEWLKAVPEEVISNVA
jgi:hypothetical protein